MTEMNENCVIKIENLSKEYRLGAIGSGTLRHDLQSWYAKKKEVKKIRIRESVPTIYERRHIFST